MENHDYEHLKDKAFENQLLGNSSWRGTRLENVSFKNSVMEGADFSGAEFINVTVTLNCNTFDNIRLDLTTFKLMMLLFSRVNLGVEKGIGVLTLSRLKEYLFKKGPTFTGLLEQLMGKKELLALKEYIANTESEDEPSHF